MATGLAFDDRCGCLLVGSESGDIEIWDMSTGNLRQVISQAHPNRVSALQFTTDGKSFFSSSTLMDAIKLWDTDTGELLYSVKGFLGPAISVQGDHIYLLAKTSEVYFFNSQQLHLYPQAYRVSGVVQSLAVDKERGLLGIGTASGSIDLFNILNKPEPGLEKTKAIKPYKTGDWVKAVHFSPDAQSLYSVSASGQIDQWSVPALDKQKSISASGNFASSAKFLPGRELLAIVGNSDKNGVKHNNAIELISLASGKSVVGPATTNFGQIEFIPVANLLIAFYGSTISIVSLSNDF